MAGDGALQGAAVIELAASLGMHYEATGEMRLFDEHLALLDRALELLPQGDPNLAPVHTNIAAARLRRFSLLRERGDLTAAIAAARLGIEESQPGDPNLAVRHSNLVGVLRMLHDVTGDPRVLDESIAAGRTAVAAIKAATSGQPLILASLAGSLSQRGLRALSLADLEESITIARRAMAAAPPGSPGRLPAGSILAGALCAKAQLTGEVSSLSEAITLHRENADLVPHGQPEHGLHLVHLAAALLVRYEWQEDPADLDAADDAVRRAVEPANTLTAAEAWSLRAACWRYRAERRAADGDRAGAERAAAAAVEAADKSLTAVTTRGFAGSLLIASNARAVRYEITGTSTHRGEAVTAYREAVEKLGADTADGQLALLNLGLVFLRHEGAVPVSRPDINAAISVFRRALAVTEPGGQRWGHACLGLIRAQAHLFQVAPDDVDAEDLVRLYRGVTEVTAMPARRRAAAGKLAAEMLLRADRAEDAAWILADVVRQLPVVAWRGSRRRTREATLADFSHVGCDAAASELAAGNGSPESAAKAAEVVEQGRAVLWADLLQLRRGDAELRERQPELAVRLVGLAAVLEAQEESLGSGLDHSRAVDQRMVAAVRWEEIVAEARQADPGFLRPTRLADLLPATLGPVVILNASRYRCDALIVTGAGVRSVPLPALSVADIARYVKRYLNAWDRLTRLDEEQPGTGQTVGGAAAHDPDEVLSQVLAWLWDAAAGPVLDALGFVGPPAPGRPWPRIWWCPTGGLGLLPLHAAGYHAEPPAAGAPSRTVIDRVISSYTPTLGALADVSKTDVSKTDTEADDGTLLFVGVPEAPGMAPLPGADYERDLVARKLGPRCRVLSGADATVAAVRAGLGGLEAQGRVRLPGRVPDRGRRGHAAERGHQPRLRHALRRLPARRGHAVERERLRRRHGDPDGLRRACRLRTAVAGAVRRGAAHGGP